MKLMKTFKPGVESLNRRNVETGGTAHCAPIPFQRFNAFTLIELLVVIAVITVLAALLIPAGGIMVQKAQIQRAVSEREQLTTAIDNYKSRYGYYPPSNTNVLNPMTNQLYYELIGTTMSVGSGVASNFTTLDNASVIDGNTISTWFGVGGFMNCTKSGGGSEDSLPAKQFLSGLKPSEIASNGVIDMIVTSANSDAGYQPVPGVSSLTGRPANPWRYRYPGTNNPDSYDLWVQVYVGGKTNLICNWAKNPQYNVPIE